MAADIPEQDVSAWSPLRQALFRSIWIATVVSNIGTWMQTVGVIKELLAVVQDGPAKSGMSYGA